MHNLNPNVDFITEQPAVQIGITKVRGTRYCDRSYVAFLSTSTHISKLHLKYVTSNPSKSFPIHYFSVILTFDAVQSLLLTPLWHKPQTNKQTTLKAELHTGPARQKHRCKECILVYSHHTDWLHENCSNKMILAHFIVNRTIYV